MPKNIVKRGNVWYCTARVNGKRLSKSLETADQRVAQQRARVILEAARKEKWELIEGVRSRGPAVPTLGEHVQAYRVAATQRYAAEGSPKPETVNNYVYALKSVLGAPGDDWMDWPLTKLTPDLARAYVARVLEGAAGEADIKRGRITAHSTLTNARALFPQDGRTGLPACVQAFLTVKAVKRPVAERLPHPPELIKATDEAAQRLRVDQPGLYCAFLLCRYFGLRSGEAQAARKDWLREARNNDKVIWIMDVGKAGGNFTTKGKRMRSVPMAPDVVEQLRSVWSKEGDYIVPGPTVTDRHKLVARELCAWMRTVGWSRLRYETPVHELRSIRGADWWTRIGPQAAQAYLGHRDIRTTYNHYAYLNAHADPLGMV
jgi:integrase